MKSRRRQPAKFAGGAVCLLVLHLAQAAAATDAQESLAEALFAEGRTHLLAKKYDQACPLFAESLRLDPASGTALNLALCLERQGKLVGAWTHYKIAGQLALGEHKVARESLAGQRIHQLEGRLSALIVSVPTAAQSPGLVLKLDGLPFPASAWGTPYPVDGGTHTLRAVADGRTGWQCTITLVNERDTKTIEVPILAITPTPTDASPISVERGVPTTTEPAQKLPPSAEPVPGKAATPLGSNATQHRKWIPIALGSTTAGLTVAALTVGIYYGLEASSRWSERKRLCPQEQTVCGTAAVRAGLGAERAAGISTAAFGLGVASAALTTYILWHTWPDLFPAHTAPRPMISATAEGAGLSIGGAF